MGVFWSLPGCEAVNKPLPSLSFCNCSVVRHGWGRLFPGAVTRTEVIMTAPGCLFMLYLSFCGSETDCVFGKECLSRRSPGEKHILALGSEVPRTHNLIDLQLVNFLLTLISNGSRLAPLAWPLRGARDAWPGLPNQKFNNFFI